MHSKLSANTHLVIKFYTYCWYLSSSPQCRWSFHLKGKGMEMQNYKFVIMKEKKKKFYRAVGGTIS